MTSAFCELVVVGPFYDGVCHCWCVSELVSRRGVFLEDSYLSNEYRLVC